MRTPVRCGWCGWRGARKFPLQLPCPHCERPVHLSASRGVYLLAIVDSQGEHTRYKHAAHYLGWTEHLQLRLQHHRAGRGARLIQVVREAGLDVVVVRVWPGGSRQLERHLKRQGSSTRHCPLCRAKNARKLPRACGT